MGDHQHPTEPETLAYVVHRESDSPRIRVFYELYRDPTAFDEHERMPHVRRFLTERGQHLARDPEVWWVTPFDGLVRPEADQSGG